MDMEEKMTHREAEEAVLKLEGRLAGLQDYL